MDQTGIGTPHQHITTFFTGEFTAVAVFNHVTGKISEMDTIFFKRIMLAVLMIRVNIMLGLAGTAAHAEIILIVQHLEDMLERHDRSGVLNDPFNR